MRILFVTASSGSRGGGELFLCYLGEALAARGLEVGLWCSDRSSMDELAATFSRFGEVLRCPYINTYQRHSRSFHGLFRTPGQNAWVGQWNQFRPHVLHLNKQCLEDGLDLLSAANDSEIPSICTIHITQSAHALGARFGRMRDHIARRALRAYRGRLMAIAEKRAQELQAFLHSPEPIPFIDNGVAISSPEERTRLRNEARPELVRHPDELLFVGIGRVENQKRPNDFIDYAVRVKDAEPRARFVWVGDGRLRNDFEEHIRRHDAGDYIECAGWQSDVSPFLASADVYVHPALFEGLPFSLLEAMGWGLPVVVSPEMAAELSFLSDENSQLITAPPDRLLNTRERQQLADSALRTARERFSLEAMAERYENLYRELKGSPVAI